MLQRAGLRILSPKLSILPLPLIYTPTRCLGMLRSSEPLRPTGPSTNLLPSCFRVCAREPRLSRYSSNTNEQNGEVELLIKEKITDNTVMVFSKSYCPYCKKAKELLNKYGVNFVAYEIDLEAKGPQVQQALGRLTAQNTVPNIFIGTRHIGGSDKLAALDKEGKLSDILKQAGAVIKAQTEL